VVGAGIASLLVLTMGLTIPRASTADDRVEHHRYHRLTEAEREALRESLDSTMQSVQEAVQEAVANLDLHLEQLDLSGLQALDFDIDDPDFDFDFDFDGEEFSRNMERFGEELGANMEALARNLERHGRYDWKSRRDLHRDPRKLRAKIEVLRQRIRELEAELDSRSGEGGI
jgi:uncharacterized protein YdhG (YjbR/CyaY superfamily)